MVKVRVTGSSISTALKSETEAISRRLARVPRRTCERAIGPRWARGTRSRRIANRMTTRDNGTNRAVISVDSSIGFNPVFEEEDTRPHVITPKRAGGVLAFPGRNGQTVFARRVQHPGTTGSHALKRAVRESESDFRRFVTEAIRGE